jgi:hypothetical protein
MGLTYQFEGKNFQVISCDDLPDHRVKIAYIFDGESRESVVENRKGLLPFLANLLGLDADDSIDKNTLKMLMYTDPIIFPLDEEGLPEPSIHKLDESMFTLDD